MTFLLAAIALVAFAANSVLCRLALRDGAIDPSSFTAIRVVSGALMLLLVTTTTRNDGSARRHSWYAAAMLFLYAAAFSLAYVSLSAGTGALFLFGAVQVTMLVAAMLAGERLRLPQWAGFLMAVAGLVWLVLPGVTAPSPAGALLMTVAGVAWGLYSVYGRGSAAPLLETRTNFVLAVPMALLLTLAAMKGLHLSSRGVLLAALSGAITSGLGYVVWYRALSRLSGISAGLVQLATPVITATGGILFLGEALSHRVVIATVLVLGGIALAITAKAYR